MFENSGNKIQTLARFLFGVIIVLFAIIGILAIVSGFIEANVFIIFTGFLYIALGFLLAWMYSLFLYAFGELVENSQKTVKTLALIYKNINTINSLDQKEIKFCEKCGTRLKEDQIMCHVCAHVYKSDAKKSND